MRFAGVALRRWLPMKRPEKMNSTRRSRWNSLCPAVLPWSESQPSIGITSKADSSEPSLGVSVSQWPVRGHLADRYPERRLDDEDVAAGGRDRSNMSPTPTRRAERLGARAVLLPDEIERAAGPPLPSQHDVAAERQRVEVAVPQRERRCRRSVTGGCRRAASASVVPAVP